MYQQSFAAYRNFLYLKVSLLLTAASLLLYLFADGMGPANGGTPAGYILGGLSTLLIIWLMWLGVRKRRYHSGFGSVQGWVSAHVYLGVALVFSATLHAGFEFGINVHTLAYGLMLLVVASGAYGIYAYLRFPRRLSESRGGMSREQILREIAELEQECLMLAEGLEKKIQREVRTALEKTHLGGSVWQQLSQADERGRRRRLLRLLKRREKAQAAEQAAEENSAYDDTMYIVADVMAQTTDGEAAEKMRRVIELLGRRNVLIKRFNLQAKYQSLLEIWLYLHVPLSFALLAAVMVHILTVFLYW